MWITECAISSELCLCVIQLETNVGNQNSRKRTTDYNWTTQRLLMINTNRSAHLPFHCFICSLHDYSLRTLGKLQKLILSEILQAHRYSNSSYSFFLSLPSHKLADVIRITNPTTSPLIQSPQSIMQTKKKLAQSTQQQLLQRCCTPYVSINLRARIICSLVFQSAARPNISLGAIEAL